MGNTSIPVSFAVEGDVDEAAVIKLFRESGIRPGTPYVCGGIENIRKRIAGFNAGAQHAPSFCVIWIRMYVRLIFVTGSWGKFNQMECNFGLLFERWRHG